MRGNTPGGREQVEDVVEEEDEEGPGGTHPSRDAYLDRGHSRGGQSQGAPSRGGGEQDSIAEKVRRAQVLPGGPKASTGHRFATQECCGDRRGERGEQGCGEQEPDHGSTGGEQQDGHGRLSSDHGRGEQRRSAPP
jgi:hypothetical protein